MHAQTRRQFADNRHLCHISDFTLLARPPEESDKAEVLLCLRISKVNPKFAHLPSQIGPTHPLVDCISEYMCRGDVMVKINNK